MLFPEQEFYVGSFGRPFLRKLLFPFTNGNHPNLDEMDIKQAKWPLFWIAGASRQHFLYMKATQPVRKSRPYLKNWWDHACRRCRITSAVFIAQTQQLYIYIYTSVYLHIYIYGSVWSCDEPGKFLNYKGNCFTTSSHCISFPGTWCWSHVPNSLPCGWSILHLEAGSAKSHPKQ